MSCPDRNLAVFHHYRHYEGLRLLSSVCDSKLIQQTLFNFEPYKTGMAIPHIYFKDYGKAKIFCPSYTEQFQYARLLSAIDNKLSIEQNILTKLSLQKQYLLRQMFI